MIYWILMHNDLRNMGQGQLLTVNTGNSLILEFPARLSYLPELLKKFVLFGIVFVSVPLCGAWWYGMTNHFFLGLVILTALYGALFRASMVVFGLVWRHYLMPLDLLDVRYRFVHYIGCTWLGLAISLLYAKQNYMFFNSGYHLVECLAFGFTNVLVYLGLKYLYFVLIYTQKQLVEECLCLLRLYFFFVVPVLIMEAVFEPASIADWLGGSIYSVQVLLTWKALVK